MASRTFILHLLWERGCVHLQLVRQTVTPSLGRHWILFSASDIHTPVRNSNIYTQDFCSIRFPIERMTYGDPQDRWTFRCYPSHQLPHLQRFRGETSSQWVVLFIDGVCVWYFVTCMTNREDWYSDFLVPVWMKRHLSLSFCKCLRQRLIHHTENILDSTFCPIHIQYKQHIASHKSGDIWRVPSAWYILHTGFLLGLFFDPEDGGDVFLHNIGWFPTHYMALYPRR
jgi:hypothetical protein